MESSAPITMLKLLADDTRWSIIQALRSTDRQVGELVSLLRQPQNLLSYHLGVLRQAGIVQMHRSEADARVAYYGLDLVRLSTVHDQIGAGLGVLRAHDPNTVLAAPVLFLCTENSARSQMAEGWLRALSQGRTPVRSAGTAPHTLHPLAVQVMAEAGVDIGYQYSKSIEALEGLAPAIVITVCDRAREECITQFDPPAIYHWSIPDPARGPANDQLGAFRNVRNELRVRVEGLLATNTAGVGH